jgi:hypothetical protein
VLEHVGMVAGVEGVAVGEHGPTVPCAFVRWRKATGRRYGTVVNFLAGPAAPGRLLSYNNASSPRPGWRCEHSLKIGDPGRSMRSQRGACTAGREERTSGRTPPDRQPDPQ